MDEPRKTSFLQDVFSFKDPIAEFYRSVDEYAEKAVNMYVEVETAEVMEEEQNILDAEESGIELRQCDE